MEEQAEITLAPSLKRYRTRNGGKNSLEAPAPCPEGGGTPSRPEGVNTGVEWRQLASKAWGPIRIRVEMDALVS